MTEGQVRPERVGWIGTGRMGASMARRLARGGVDLTAWNRTRSKAEPLADDGVTVVDSISELAGLDVVFTMVAASGDLEQVLVGEGGLLRGDTVPPVVVDCSTVSADASAAMRAAAAERGAEFLAAPVSGNGKVVAAGKLSFVVSGQRATFDRVEPLLTAIGRSATYVGEGEAARLVKICHNLFLGVVTQAMAEVTVLAEKSGVSRAAFLDFLNNSVMGSTFSRYKTPAFVRLDWTPTFTSTLLRKDFDLGLDLARDLDVPMQIAAMTRQLVQTAINAGHADDDFATLLELHAAAAGLKVTSEDAEVDDGLGQA
ncbi:MAG TPA: NAD(P)-dependent oxidoreductase [Mycobacteriales bacterium]|nr:NAD(P)-dependent oxidoreductase [Mycobacteriales bacterium]